MTALDRLLSANVSGGSSGQGQYGESYAYNAIGNLNATTWTYGTQSSNCPEGALSKPHAVVTAGSSAYCYDCNGNMVRRNVGSTYNLSYDAENRLTTVSGVASASFLYDGDGNRVKATFGDNTHTDVITCHRCNYLSQM
jgi:hypothetical protein